jgi:predicted enzyme related to lactoylglutathione lyase
MSDDEEVEPPGSTGEQDLQERFDTIERALRFYENGMHWSLNEVIKGFSEERIMFFLTTADANGATDCSP